MSITSNRRWLQITFRELALVMVAIGFALAWLMALRDAERERHNSAAVNQLIEALGVEGAFEVTGKNIGGDSTGAASLVVHGLMGGHPVTVTIKTAGPLKMDFRKASIGKQSSE